MRTPRPWVKDDEISLNPLLAEPMSHLLPLLRGEEEVRMGLHFYTTKEEPPQVMIHEVEVSLREGGKGPYLLYPRPFQALPPVGGVTEDHRLREGQNPRGLRGPQGRKGGSVHIQKVHLRNALQYPHGPRVSRNGKGLGGHGPIKGPYGREAQDKVTEGSLMDDQESSFRGGARRCRHRPVCSPCEPAVRRTWPIPRCGHNGASRRNPCGSPQPGPPRCCRA